MNKKTLLSSNLICNKIVYEFFKIYWVVQILKYEFLFSCSSVIIIPKIQILYRIFWYKISLFDKFWAVLKKFEIFDSKNDDVIHHLMQKIQLFFKIEETF